MTYARHPLYRYAQDSDPGNVNGQGVNDAWFAVTLGTAVEGKSPAAGEPGY